VFGSTLVETSVPPTLATTRAPGVIMDSPAWDQVPGSWVMPAGLKATAEGSSARATSVPPRALPRALNSYRANPAAKQAV